MEEFNEHHIKTLCDLLGHSGHHSQLHCHSTSDNRVVSRELVSGFAEILKWAKAFNGQGNCFIGRAARDASGNVSTNQVLTLDIDPIREKGAAATDAEHREAIQAGRKVIRELRCGVLASSGNGALVLFPTGSSMDKETCESMGKVLENKARQLLQGEAVNVDSTWDFSRLIKLIGTKSTKGHHDLHRYTRFIDLTNAKRLIGDVFRKEAKSLSSSSKQSLPQVSKGDLDRSKADFAIGLRLQAQGFSAGDTYKALCEYGLREGREDDAKRIVEKLYSGKSAVVGNAEPKPLQLWTPENGLADYQQRDTRGQPELPTGFRGVDDATFGLIRGHIFTVGARTNCGKTTFAISVSANLCRLRKRVLFISTETQYSEVWDRYIAASTGISAFKLQHGLSSDEDQKRLSTFIGEFKQQGFIVYDGSRPSTSLIRQAIEQSNPDVVVIDYFQHGEGREVRELEELVMNLKELAKEKQIALLMCAQLHDGQINPKTNRLFAPTLGSMKNSKVLNDESRVVLLLDWDRDDAQGDGPAAVKVLMAKNKGSRTDCILKLDRSVPRFIEESL